MLIVLLGLIFLLAGTIQGLTGFGAGLVAIPLLALYIDIKIAVPLCILNGLAMITYMGIQLREQMELKKILPLIIGSIPGIFTGTLLLKVVNPSTMTLFLGILLISYSLYNLWAKPKSLNPGTIWGYIAGFFTGTITAMVSAGGPPAIIYTTLTNWKKLEIKATLTGFFAFNAFFTAIVYIFTGVITGTTLKYFALTCPFILLGTFLGTRLTNKINRRTYLRIVYLFLLVMGCLMIAL